LSADDECIAGSSSLVTGWGRMGGEDVGRGRELIKGAERVVEKERNGF
jgi:hypothetical protein